MHKGVCIYILIVPHTLSILYNLNVGVSTLLLITLLKKIKMKFTEQVSFFSLLCEIVSLNYKKK